MVLVYKKRKQEFYIDVQKKYLDFRFNRIFATYEYKNENSELEIFPQRNYYP